MTKKIWEKYFKPPYKFEDDKMYLFDSENQMVLMMADDAHDEELAEAIEKILNGEPVKGSFDVIFTLAEDGEVFTEDTCVFTARGWGYLTAPGGCDLSEEEAGSIQDAMLAYVLDKLNKNQGGKTAENRLLETVLVEGKFEYGKPLYHYHAEEAERITGTKKLTRSLLKLWRKHIHPKRRKGRNRCRSAFKIKEGQK